MRSEIHIDLEKLDRIISNKLKDSSERDEILNSMLSFIATQNVQNFYILERKITLSDSTEKVAISAKQLARMINTVTNSINRFKMS